MAKFEVLKIKDIIVSEGHNVRQYAGVTDQALIDLGNSLEEDGQLMPILVNRDDAGVLHLIAGERRLHAAKNAGLDEIEAKVYDDLDARAATRLHLIENINRKPLNVLEEALGMQRLEDCGETLPDIAALYGVSVDTVKRRMGLLELPQDVQRMITRDKFALPVHQAQLLVGLSDCDALQIARKAAPSVGPVASETQVREWVDAIKNGPKLPLADDSGPRPADRGKKTDLRSPTSAEDKKSWIPSEDLKQGVPHGNLTPDAASPVGAAETADGVLEPVAGGIGLVGSVAIYPESYSLEIKKAVLTIKLGDGVRVVKTDVVVQFGESARAELVAAFVAAQPKPEPEPETKTSAKKRVKKKKE